MGDIVRVAEYLPDLKCMSDSIGLCGLSYGGYATLQLPGIHPGVFNRDREAHWPRRLSATIASAAVLICGFPIRPSSSAGYGKNVSTVPTDPVSFP